MPVGAFITNEIKDLISNLLVLEPSARVGVDNFEELLAHRVFKDVDFSRAYDSEPNLHPR